MQILYKNNKVKFDYEIIKKYEAGIILYGWEVKSVKERRFNIEGSFIKRLDEELYLTKAKIIPLRTAEIRNKEFETRDRKLLLNKSQINNIISEIKASGITAVPYEIYINDKGLIKLTIALVKGKRKYQKKESQKKKDIEKELSYFRKYYNI